MKKSELDTTTSELIDELVDIYSTMEQAAFQNDEFGKAHLLIKCIGDKAYRIKIEPAGKLIGVPWSH